MKYSNLKNTIKTKFLYFVIVGLFFNLNLFAQMHDLVSITGVFSGIDTDDTMFKAKSKTIPTLFYIRAQVVEGPQKGLFTQSGNNIRYTSISDVKGIPENLSKIRFTFLQSDKKTLISPSNFRFIINDIDGPNNESLAVKCSENVHFIGTSNPTNLVVDNIPPDLKAVGTVDESDGPTSRVMFEFKNIAIVEFDNYANDGYLKDFDMDDEYPIAIPILVKCIDEKKVLNDSIITTSKIKEKINVTIINTKPVYFKINRYKIEKEAAVELEKVILIMKKYPKIIIEVRSHTDAREPDEYNLALSEKRANATVNWIVSKGIDATRVKGKGFGETQLINKCLNGVKCTEAEHKLNRRTEFVIVNPEVIKEQ
jgi:outer membrane protein OmpA-like peptidoglycan-associated protein